MSGARLLPHRAASQAAIAWGRWLAQLDASDPAPVADRLQGWDYQSRLAFELTARISSEHLIESTGIQDQTLLRIVGLVDCKSAGRRFTAFADLPAEPNPSVTMRIEVPCGEVAAQLELSAHLVLARGRPGRADGSATRAGARLAQSESVRVVLEGEGSRFPTEVASFSALRLERSLWSLQVRPEALDSSFVGSARLLVNADIPASAALLSADGDSSTFRFLQMDIARQLISAVVALDPPEADLLAEWEEGTFGRAAQELARELLGSDLATCASYVKSDSTRFERLLQDAFAPWEAD